MPFKRHEGAGIVDKLRASVLNTGLGDMARQNQDETLSVRSEEFRHSSEDDDVRQGTGAIGEGLRGASPRKVFTEETGNGR